MHEERVERSARATADSAGFRTGPTLPLALCEFRSSEEATDAELHLVREQLKEERERRAPT